MTVSTEDKLKRLERDLNRLMQRLLEVASTEDVEAYRALHEARVEDLTNQAKRLEILLEALQQKHAIAKREKISE